MAKRKQKPKPSSPAAKTPANPSVVLMPHPQAAPGQQSLTISASQYAGPIPPPQMLAGYEEIVPGAADRILKMAESQASHRQALEHHVITSDARRAWAGLAVGGTLSLVLILAGAYLVAAGHDWAGATIVTGTLVALAGTYLSATSSRRHEREGNAVALAGQQALGQKTQQSQPKPP